MKPASSSLIATLSFLLWFSFTSAADQVLDVDGDPLVAGKKYHILSATWGAGAGAVNAQKTGASSCSYSVFVSGGLIWDYMGDPVKFSIPGESTGKIYENSTFLEIKFADKPLCGDWIAAFDESDSSAPGKLVIGRSRDHPNSILMSGDFRVEKYFAFYKLVFCRKIATFAPLCFTVGRGEGGQLILKDLGEFPFMLIFVKGDDSAKGIRKSII